MQKSRTPSSLGSWTSVEVPLGNSADPVYKQQLLGMQQRLDTLTAKGEPLFKTDTSGLWQVYLGAFPRSSRQYHDCTACKRFVEVYGGLVTINAQTGKTNSLFWSSDADACGLEEGIAVKSLARCVESLPVKGVFLSSETVWGTPLTGGTRTKAGEWRHFGFKSPLVFKVWTHNAGQQMAEKLEEYKNVQRALGEFQQRHLDQAVELLEADTLYRGEAVLGPAKFLRDLKRIKTSVSTRERANIIWRAVAAAPAGFCHPRSSMVGTLLEDLSSGTSLQEAARKFAAKMAPLSYRRPTAPPKAGNLDAAEKIIAQLGAQGSLKRRFARLEDLETVWRTSPAEPMREAVGVFGHLRQHSMTRNFGTPGGILDGGTMTWKKFERVVLPGARRIELKVPRQGHFFALVTAADPDAPAILQWDREEQRNPVSWYVYPSGSVASSWNLLLETWTEVPAITLQPSMWHGVKSAHHGESVMFVLQGARDLNYKGCGLGLFPQIMRSEFHSISSTIEAFSRRGVIEGSLEGNACGIRLDDKTGEIRVRVTSSAGLLTEYRVDRFE